MTAPTVDLPGIFGWWHPEPAADPRIPDPLEPDQLCRVPACVMPLHLEVVTHRFNVLRGLDGESYIGRDIRLGQDHAEYRGSVWVLVLADRDGEERSPWLLHTALLNGLKRLKPKPGELIGVKNLGKRKNQNGTGYVDSRVAVDRTASWDDVDPGEGEP
jgi:hypothetical protein